MRNSSTFGQVLMWVRNRLQQVEVTMSQKPQSNRSAKNSVSSTRHSIDNLLKHDSTLENEYIAAAEEEYEKLVNLIQNRKISITKDLENLADDIRNS